MRFFGLNIAFILFIIACTPQNKKDLTENSHSQNDASLLMDDTVPDTRNTSMNQPDASFDDFIYTFMQDSLFQKRRIIFPLHYFKNGVVNHVPKSEWHYDEMYRNQDLYTFIYDSEKSLSVETDSGLQQIVVENVYFEKSTIRQYCFVKCSHFWMLNKIDEHDISKDINHDFYMFYRHFVNDENFQKAHIKNPFLFRTYDAENDWFIEGFLDSEQWPDYRPLMPKDTLTNINYEQHYEQSNKRVVLICSPSGGMGCIVTFVRHGHKWMFERLEN